MRPANSQITRPRTQISQTTQTAAVNQTYRGGIHQQLAPQPTATSGAFTVSPALNKPPMELIDEDKPLPIGNFYGVYITKGDAPELLTAGGFAPGDLVVAQIHSNEPIPHGAPHAWIIAKILGCDTFDQFCELIYDTPSLFLRLDSPDIDQGIFSRFISTGFKNFDGDQVLANGYEPADGLHVSDYHTNKGYGQLQGDNYLDFLKRTGKETIWKDGERIDSPRLNEYLHKIFTGSVNLPENRGIHTARMGLHEMRPLGGMTPTEHMKTIVEKIGEKRPGAHIYLHKTEAITGNPVFSWNVGQNGALTPDSIWLRSAQVIHPYFKHLVDDFNTRN